MIAALKSRIPDANVWLLFAATLLLSSAYGMAVSIIGLYLDERGLSKTEVGNLAVVFALGIVALSLPMGGIARRLSAKRTLVIALLGYAGTVLVFPRLPGFGWMAGVRFLDGVFSVGVWVASEIILLARARDEHKAYATSLYAIMLALGYVVGPLLAKIAIGWGGMPAVFHGAGALAIGAAALLALKLDPDPPEMHEEVKEKGGGEAPGSLDLLRRIKTSCFATFSYGYFQATA
ncbi:MAG TPA: MFS transporter, partial [Candidatus Nanopelagicales bacterium]|nr:MFS transporter [Candidatus Nanopelagicales bacterium]